MSESILNDSIKNIADNKPMLVGKVDDSELGI